MKVFWGTPYTATRCLSTDCQGVFDKPVDRQ